METVRFELTLPLKLGKVNCYVLRTERGCVLVDTGPSHQRVVLERALMENDVRQLQSIIITHGDFDHTGNAAYLRQRFGAAIAMHAGDRAMAERGDMFAGRNKGSRLLGAISGLLFGFRQPERFAPDVLLADGDALIELGLEAQAIVLPGHSSGSLGILTAGGDLFCGDLLENTASGPALGSIIDDAAAARASLTKLQGMTIGRVYPGHGQPFEAEALAQL